MSSWSITSAGEGRRPTSTGSAQGVNDFLKADVRDPRAMNDLLARHGDADAVLHLASQVAVTTSILNLRDDFETNALGTFNVLEAVRTVAQGRPAVFYSSTNKVYGDLEHIRVVERDGRYTYEDRPFGVDEHEPLDFKSPYGCSKGAGDQYVRDYARIYGLRTVVFRQSCIYGTRQFGIEDQGWIAWFCVAVTLGRPFTIYGDGKQIRDTLWVGDLIDAYERAFERIGTVQGEVFNIGGGPSNTLSLRELVAALEQHLGRPLHPPHADWRPGDQRVFVADIRKAERPRLEADRLHGRGDRSVARMGSRTSGALYDAERLTSLDRALRASPLSGDNSFHQGAILFLERSLDRCDGESRAGCFAVWRWRRAGYFRRGSSPRLGSGRVPAWEGNPSFRPTTRGTRRSPGCRWTRTRTS